MEKNINTIMNMSFANFSNEISSSNTFQETFEIHWPDFQPYYPTIKEYYPIYLGWQNENKIEKAFKIVNILLKEKIIKLDKVKDFVELVNVIAKEI